MYLSIREVPCKIGDPENIPDVNDNRPYTNTRTQMGTQFNAIDVFISYIVYWKTCTITIRASSW